MEGWRLRFPAAAARAAEAWDWPLIGTLDVVPAWTWVEAFVMPPPAALRELEERCLREGVGCVAPVMEVDECEEEAFEATDAD
jgi:hypothetical protein